MNFPLLPLTTDNHRTRTEETSLGENVIQGLTEEEITEIQSTWKSIISDKTSEHGVNILIRFFKNYPEYKAQYFQNLNTLSEDELRESPKLRSHGAGFVLAITQIISDLDNMLIVEEVAKKIARNHYTKGIREPLNYKLMTNTILDYIKDIGNLADGTMQNFRKMFDIFIISVRKKDVCKIISNHRFMNLFPYFQFLILDIEIWSWKLLEL